jgi:hypothetical protein
MNSRNPKRPSGDIPIHFPRQFLCKPDFQGDASEPIRSEQDCEGMGHSPVGKAIRIDYDERSIEAAPARHDFANFTE